VHFLRYKVHNLEFCGETGSPIRSSVSQDQQPITMDPPDDKYAIHEAAREGRSMKQRSLLRYSKHSLTPTS
jgi:hypothetical protein